MVAMLYDEVMNIQTVVARTPLFATGAVSLLLRGGRSFAIPPQFGTIRLKSSSLHGRIPFPD